MENNRDLNIETEYQNYLYVRDRVIKMKQCGASGYEGTNQPSDYWQEELVNFDYMMDASPLIVRKLRHHCYHLTGISIYDYRTNQHAGKRAFEAKLHALKAKDRNDLLIPESRMLGGFGFEIDGQLYNIDTLKFYEALIALDHVGILDRLRNAVERTLVCEIGGGWGGFAYQFKSLFPNITYLIIDFPEVFLFSAVYLKTVFPNAHVLMYGDVPHEKTVQNWRNYDFIFVPNTFLDKMNPDKMDLVVNMVSFQEMTSAQVDKYTRKMSELGCPNLYSLNREKSPYNDQLTSVSSIIGRYYKIREVKILRVSYAQTLGRRQIIEGAILEIARKILRTIRKRPTSAYRHLVGQLWSGSRTK